MHLNHLPLLFVRLALDMSAYFFLTRQSIWACSSYIKNLMIASEHFHSLLSNCHRCFFIQVDNAELRQAVGELTNSLKQLQMENESLRQRLNGNMGPQENNSANGPRNWSFSSESIPNTPCSPPDTTQQTNFRLVNGQPYSTLSWTM